jgi:hypothetical protein
MQNLSFLVQSGNFYKDFRDFEILRDTCEMLDEKGIPYKTIYGEINNVDREQLWVNSDDLPVAKKLLTDYLHSNLKRLLQRQKLREESK